MVEKFDEKTYIKKHDEYSKGDANVYIGERKAKKIIEKIHKIDCFPIIEEVGLYSVRDIYPKPKTHWWTSKHWCPNCDKLLKRTEVGSYIILECSCGYDYAWKWNFPVWSDI